MSGYQQSVDDGSESGTFGSELDNFYLKRSIELSSLDPIDIWKKSKGKGQIC